MQGTVFFSIQGDVVNAESDLFFLQREINMTNKINKKQKNMYKQQKYSPYHGRVER